MKNRTAKPKPTKPAPDPLRLDPTRTGALRRRFAADLRARFMRIRREVVALVGDEDAFGLKPSRFTFNERWRGYPDPEKLEAFKMWLRERFRAHGLTDAQLWRKYVEEGFKAGAGRAFTDTRRQGFETEDFYRGSKEEFLRSAFGRPVAVEKVQLLVSRTMDDLEGVTEQMGRAMTRTLADGLVQGQSPREIARNLVVPADSYAGRAEAIARDSIIRVHAEGQLMALEELGVEEVGVAVEWSTTGDGKVCRRCASLKGVVLKIAEARGMLPVHPRCIVGDSVVVADDVLAVLKSHYTGEVVELITVGGRRLTVTPNHMLLTEFGFLPARFAYEGLKVVKAAGIDAELAGAPDDDRHEARIADVFAALAENPLMLSERMPAAPEDLHGDGRSCDAEIHVVRPHGELRDQAERGARLVEGQFPAFQFLNGEGLLPALSPAAQFLKRMALAADGSMGRFREPLAFLLAHLLHADDHGLAAVAWGEARRLQPLIDGGSAAAEAFRECLRTHPLLEQAYDFVGGELQSVAGRCYANRGILSRAEIDAGSFEAAGDGILRLAESGGEFTGRHAAVVEADEIGVGCRTLDAHGALHAGVLVGSQVDACPLQSHRNGPTIYPEVGSDFVGGTAGVVKFDKVVSIKVNHVIALPVYDLQTDSTLYRVNGLITSNCRCAWIPANVGESSAGQKDTKPAIDRAIKAAQAGDKSGWGPGKPIAKERPESILD